jgi:hypothetical protein
LAFLWCVYHGPKPSTYGQPGARGAPEGGRVGANVAGPPSPTAPASDRAQTLLPGTRPFSPNPSSLLSSTDRAPSHHAAPATASPAMAGALKDAQKLFDQLKVAPGRGAWGGGAAAALPRARPWRARAARRAAAARGARGRRRLAWTHGRLAEGCRRLPCVAQGAYEKKKYDDAKKALEQLKVWGGGCRPGGVRRHGRHARENAVASAKVSGHGNLRARQQRSAAHPCAPGLAARPQVKLVQLPAMPPASAPSPTAQQELQLARERPGRRARGGARVLRFPQPPHAAL